MLEINYRIKQLASTKNSQGKLPVAPVTIWRWVKQGHFPKPYKLGPRTTVWSATEIDTWIEAQVTKGAK